MAERHIRAWSAFMTIYTYKNSCYKVDADTELKIEDGGLKVDVDVPENSVTPKELATVIEKSEDTGRRRMESFLKEGLVHKKQDVRPYSYVPTNIRPTTVAETLEEL